MVAQSLKSQSFAGTINYVLKKDADVLKAEGVMALSAKTLINSFELQRSVRPNIKSPVGHITMSYAPEDKDRMTDEFMIKLAEEYMDKMGFTNTQYVIVRHHDNPNEHCHIVYNRINNDGKLISLHDDFKRNEKVSKELKDKYNLTYGKDKSRVRVDKLQGLERTRHEIFHAVKAEVEHCRTFTELQNRLKNHGITIDYKLKRGTDEVQGISFSKDNCSFKASKIDRKFSYANLRTTLNNNFKHRIPYKLGGIKLTDEQRTNLDDGKTVYMENLTDKLGGVYNAWVRWSDVRDRLDFYNRDPDTLHINTQPQQPQGQHQSQSDGTLVSGGTGLFDLPVDGGDDPEEAMFMNKMQQQHKKKRGRRM